MAVVFAISMHEVHTNPEVAFPYWNGGLVNTVDSPYGPQLKAPRVRGSYTRDIPPVSTFTVYGWFWPGSSIMGEHNGFVISDGTNSIKVFILNDIILETDQGTWTVNTGTLQYQWHYFAIEKSGSAVNVYMDGVLIASGTTSLGTANNFGFTYRNQRDWADYAFFDIVITDAPYGGESFHIQLLDPSSVVSSTSMTPTNAATLDDAVSPPLDGNSYAYSSLDQGGTASAEFGTTPYQIPDGLVIGSVEAVYVAAVSQQVSGNPSSIRIGVSDGTTVTESADKSITTADTYYQEIFETNPATGQSWTHSEATALNITLKHNHG